MEGIFVQKYKLYMMAKFNISARGVDQPPRNSRMPFVVYGVKEYVKLGGLWQEVDYSKIGHARSLFNRARGWMQIGSDVRTQWTIECINEEVSVDLEYELGKFLAAKRVSDTDTFATEVFKLSTYELRQAIHQFLETKTFDIYKDKITKVNLFFEDVCTVLYGDDTWEQNFFSNDNCLEAPTPRPIGKKKPSARSKFNELIEYEE